MRNIVVTVTLLACSASAFARSPLDERWISQKVEAGIKAYQEGKHDEALQAFSDARARNWESAEIQLDVGAAMAKKKDVDKARALFAKAAESKDAQLRAAALYNLGQLDLAGGELKPAAARFRNALRLNPNDADAKHNLEVALARLEEQKKKEEEDKKNQPSPQPSPNPSPNPSPSSSPSPSPSPNPSPSPEASPSPSPGSSPSPSPNPSPDASPSPDPNASPSASPSPDASPSPNPSSSPQPSPNASPSPQPSPGQGDDAKQQPASPSPGQPPPEAREARRLLDSLEDDEKKNQKDLMLQKMKREADRPVEKDW